MNDTSIASNGGTTYHDETVIWSGKPSQWVNFGTYIFWLVTMVAVSILWVFWQLEYSQQSSDLINQVVGYSCMVVLVLALGSMFYSYLWVRNEYTEITKNKIMESTGIIAPLRSEKYCELCDITDIQTPSPGFMGLVGLEQVRIETEDTDQPVIMIRGIRTKKELIGELLPIWRQLRIIENGALVVGNEKRS